MPLLCCPSQQALLGIQEREGKLKLLHFRRVKQLGAGDVGLVDLVQLQVGLPWGSGGQVEVSLVLPAWRAKRAGDGAKGRGRASWGTPRADGWRASATFMAGRSQRQPDPELSGPANRPANR